MHRTLTGILVCIFIEISPFLTKEKKMFFLFSDCKITASATDEM